MRPGHFFPLLPAAGRASLPCTQLRCFAAGSGMATGLANKIPEMVTAARTAWAAAVVVGGAGAALLKQEVDKRGRLAKLDERYRREAQPALGWLGAQKDSYVTHHELWEALQFRPSAAAAAAPGAAAAAQLASRQLRAALVEDLMAEQLARNSLKSFWSDLLDTMDAGELPASFGVSTPPLPRNGSSTRRSLGEQLAVLRQLRWLPWAERLSPGAVRFASGMWAKRANNFREVVEPFDIANYYRAGLHTDSGPYLASRPKVFKRLEAMHVARARNEAKSTFRSSLVWAEAAQAALPSGGGAPVMPANLAAPLAKLPLPPVEATAV